VIAYAHILATGASKSGALDKTPGTAKPVAATIWVLACNGAAKHATTKPEVRNLWLKQLDPKHARKGQLLSDAWTVVEVTWDA
jgi:hypothetical protein